MVERNIYIVFFDSSDDFPSDDEIKTVSGLKARGVELPSKLMARLIYSRQSSLLFEFDRDHTEERSLFKRFLGSNELRFIEGSALDRTFSEGCQIILIAESDDPETAYFTDRWDARLITTQVDIDIDVEELSREVEAFFERMKGPADQFIRRVGAAGTRFLNELGGDDGIGGLFDSFFSDRKKSTADSKGSEKDD